MLKSEKMLVVSVVTLFMEIGCNQPAPRSANDDSATRVQTPAIQGELTDAEIDKYLDGGQMSIEPSQVRNITGDLRPNWIVTGRIRNNYPLDLKQVTVRLIAYDKDERSDVVLDTAEFEVEDVPVLQAKAFRRQVQLMVTPRQFRFTWTISGLTLFQDGKPPWGSKRRFSCSSRPMMQEKGEDLCCPAHPHEFH